MSYLPHHLWDYIFSLSHKNSMKPTLEKIKQISDVEYICSIFWCSTYCLYHLVYKERFETFNIVSDYQRDYESWLDEFTECINTIGTIDNFLKKDILEKLKTSERYIEMLKEARLMDLDLSMKRKNISVWRKFKKTWGFIL